MHPNRHGWWIRIQMFSHRQISVDENSPQRQNDPAPPLNCGSNFLELAVPNHELAPCMHWEHCCELLFECCTGMSVNDNSCRWLSMELSMAQKTYDLDHDNPWTSPTTWGAAPGSAGRVHTQVRRLQCFRNHGTRREV